MWDLLIKPVTDLISNVVDKVVPDKNDAQKAKEALAAGSIGSSQALYTGSGRNTFLGATNNLAFYTGSGPTLALTLDTSQNATFAGQVIVHDATFHRTLTTMTNGAASNTGTLTNAPVAGNPTKWVPVNDNGTTRYVPMW